jgi:hypothetical protein
MIIVTPRFLFNLVIVAIVLGFVLGLYFAMNVPV